LSLVGGLASGTEIVRRPPPTLRDGAGIAISKQ
jgi:hypothetical protein